MIARIFVEQRPTIFFGVPAVFRALLEYRRQGHSLDTSSLRVCASAGEALPARIFNEWQNDLGLQILDTLGSTELLHVFIANRLDRISPGSSGVPVPGYEVRLLDEAGQLITQAKASFRSRVQALSPVTGIGLRRPRRRQTKVG